MQGTVTGIDSIISLCHYMDDKNSTVVPTYMHIWMISTERHNRLPVKEPSNRRISLAVQAKGGSFIGHYLFMFQLVRIYD